MTATRSTNDCTELDGGVLGRLSFEWTGDRYQHRWTFGDDSQVVIQSVESDHSDQWPASPPLQQVYRQDFTDGRNVLFGVGMAGRGHWSASFTLVPDLKSWIVELACCSPTAPRRLSVHYDLLAIPQLQFNSSDENIRACCFEEFGVRLEPLSGFTQFQHLDSDLIISPESLENGSATLQGSTTIQWGYRLRVE